MKIPFELPIPDGFNSNPIWHERNFLIDGESFAILEYSENFAGWSDELTTLHEEAVGDHHPIDIASRKNAISRVTDFRPNADTVIMEIGCSSGFLIKELVHFFPSSVVIGADVVKEPLKKLANLLPGVPLIRFDLLKCPLPNGSVDVLIMLNVLEHIQDDIDALKKAFDLLSPGGRLIIEVPAGPSLYDDYDTHLQHFRRYSSRELEKKLQFAGFVITKKSHLGAILFPAFATVKYINKLFPKKNTLSVVRNSASSTGSSTLVNWAMKFESKYLGNFKLPMGIRVLMTAEKPLQ